MLPTLKVLFERERIREYEREIVATTDRKRNIINYNSMEINLAWWQISRENRHHRRCHRRVIPEYNIVIFRRMNNKLCAATHFFETKKLYLYAE